MKKFIALLLVAVMTLSLVACGNAEETTPVNTVKVGLICLHDENSTYDANFITPFKEVMEAHNIPYLVKTNVPEGQECYEAAVDLVDQGCTIIFADSFGHESYLLTAAKEYPNVQFHHATGTTAHTEKLQNFHNGFAAIYEGRYLDGVVLGLKLKEMYDAPVVGYVSAHPYAECISGYTSFFLGVRAVCPTATMKVRFTGSWYDETAENEAANTLIREGCVGISGHADSFGVPNACKNANIPFVFYNGDISDTYENCLISTRINWAPYYEAMISGEPMDYDFCGDYASGSVKMTNLNTKSCAKDTAVVLADIEHLIINHQLNVFSTDSFTVGGKTLTSYMADVDTDAAYTGDTEAISGGYFHESEYRSAPYFDLQIDGITLE